MQLIPGWELKRIKSVPFRSCVSLTMQLIPGWELKRNDRGDGRRDSIPYNAANSRMGIET